MKLSLTGEAKALTRVGHVRHWGLAQDDTSTVRAQLYYPFAQVPDFLMSRFSELMSIAVRTTNAPMPLVSSLAESLRGSHNDQVLYEIRQRLPEYGLRVALGARTADVIHLVLLQASPMLMAGVGCGALLAFGAARLIGHWVPGIQPDAPVPFVTMVAVMALSAVFTGFLPARKESRVDPAEVFRME